MRHDIKPLNMNRLLSTLILILLTANLFSQTDVDKKHPIDIKCEQCLKADSSFTTYGMIRCQAMAATEWDLELNKYYKLLMTVLSSEEKEKLKTAQIKWLDYRDKEFTFSQTFYNNMKGTMWRIVDASRQKMIIRQRALELKEYYDILTPNN
jgi:uncharacterized protein YecT (DUF1311 family)